METIPQVCTALQTVLTEVPETVATAMGYTKRPDVAKFTASTLVQTLVLGWLAHPDATVEQLAQAAARVGVDVSPQAIDQRFTMATAQLLRTVLEHAVQQVVVGTPVALPLLQRFTEVPVLDSTTIVLPDILADAFQGCGGSTTTNTAAALKGALAVDLLTGRLMGLDLVDGRAADPGLDLQHAPIPAGALRLADLGFFSMDVFAEIAATGGFWLSRVEAQVMVRLQRDAPPMPLLALLQRLGNPTHWEGSVFLGATHRLPARMIIQRVPQKVAAQRRARLRATAKRKGETVSANRLALAGWTIIVTNVPAERLSADEALVLLRLRWQIELLFKLWKSHGLLDEWRTTKPARILCEVYAKWIALLIQHWAFVMGCWEYPNRSLVKAAQIVRDMAVELAHVVRHQDQLRELLQRLTQVLRRLARLNPRRNHPNTYQLLNGVDDPSYGIGDEKDA